MYRQNYLNKYLEESLFSNEKEKYLNIVKAIFFQNSRNNKANLRHKNMKPEQKKLMNTYLKEHYNWSFDDDNR